MIPANDNRVKLRTKNGSNGARTRDLSRVRRTLIPAELCFHNNNYSTTETKIKTAEKKLRFKLCR